MSNRSDRAGLALAVLAGFGLGTIAMYILDPVSGRRRREQARDLAMSAAEDAAVAVRNATRELRSRMPRAPGDAGAPASNVIRWTGPERRRKPRQ